MSAYPSGSKPRRLPECSEARGELLRVFESYGQCIAAFSWGAVSLPAELQEKLQAFMGKECVILRLDGRYHVRAVD